MVVFSSLFGCYMDGSPTAPLNNFALLLEAPKRVFLEFLGFFENSVFWLIWGSRGLQNRVQDLKIPQGTYLQLQIVKFSSIFMDSGLFSQYFAYKRYFNTIIGPWDLSRIVDNGLIYILTEYNVFWTDLARSGLVRTGPARVWSGSVSPKRAYF